MAGAFKGIGASLGVVGALATLVELYVETGFVDTVRRVYVETMLTDARYIGGAEQLGLKVYALSQEGAWVRGERGVQDDRLGDREAGLSTRGGVLHEAVRGTDQRCGFLSGPRVQQKFTGTRTRTRRRSSRAPPRRRSVGTTGAGRVRSRQRMHGVCVTTTDNTEVQMIYEGEITMISEGRDEGRLGRTREFIEIGGTRVHNIVFSDYVYTFIDADSGEFALSTVKSGKWQIVMAIRRPNGELDKGQGPALWSARRMCHFSDWGIPAWGGNRLNRAELFGVSPRLVGARHRFSSAEVFEDEKGGKRAGCARMDGRFFGVRQRAFLSIP